jgi:hypothetical protein
VCNTARSQLGWEGGGGEEESRSRGKGGHKSRSSGVWVAGTRYTSCLSTGCTAPTLGWGMRVAMVGLMIVKGPRTEPSRIASWRGARWPWVGSPACSIVY